MRLVATCARGTEGALRQELVALRFRGAKGGRGLVAFEGTVEEGMRACLWLRTAVRVLLPLARFAAPDADALYQGASQVDWSEWLTTRTTLAVEASGTTPALAHTGFAALKVKDAVVDVLRARLGARPDVDSRDPDVRIVLHLGRGEAELSLDLAGEPLHRRGYRAAMTGAPLKETLAAAVLLLGGVERELPFLDPMCGSGTLAIEQALSARHLAPGLRHPLAFQRWPGYRGALQSAWDRMKEEARARALPRAPAPIWAGDLSPRAVEATRRNAAAAGVLEDVQVAAMDAREVAPRSASGTFCSNPPYGERLGSRPLQLAGFYRGLGAALRRFSGWRAVLLSGNPLLERELGVRPESSHRLWNGPLEVRLLRYRVP
jgi:putative N6-adenine-specific DNA methylase